MPFLFVYRPAAHAHLAPVTWVYRYIQPYFTSPKAVYTDPHTVMSSFSTTLSYNVVSVPPTHSSQNAAEEEPLFGWVTSVYSVPQSQTSYTTTIPLQITGLFTPYIGSAVLVVPASEDVVTPTSDPNSYTTTLTYSTSISHSTSSVSGSNNNGNEGFVLSNFALVGQAYTFPRNGENYMTVVTPGPPIITTSGQPDNSRATIVPVPAKGDPLEAAAERATAAFNGPVQGNGGKTGLYAAVGVLAGLLVLSLIAVGLLGFKLRSE